MAYHEGEGKAFTKPPAVLMCPRSRGQRKLFVSLATRKNQKTPKWCLLNRAANKQSDSPIGSLSVQVSRLAGVVLSAVYLVRRQMDSDNKSATRCPSRCMLSHFPSVLFLQLWDAPRNLKRNTSNYLRWRNERRQRRRQDSRQNSKCAFR